MPSPKSGRPRRAPYMDGDMPPRIPSKKKAREKKSAYLPTSMWEDLTRIAKLETEKQHEEISMNWVMEWLLRYAIDDYYGRNKKE